MKVAIVHDWLSKMGGAERIIRLFHDMYPEAPIYTLVYDRENMPSDFEKMDIRTTFIQRIPLGVKYYTAFLPLMPTAFELLDLSDYDLVLSSSSSCAKGVITGKDTIYICYCNTPMRYAWNMFNQYIKNKSAISRVLIGVVMNYIRIWDRISADRVDYFIANSQNVAARIKKYYQRESTVIYPPIRTDYYTAIKRDYTSADKVGDYYLIVSRLVSYKKIDIVIKAFNSLKIPLKVIGEGSEYKYLRSLSKSNVEFLGKLSDNQIRDYYRRCRAFILPGEEDFGMTPLEAQACGRPVLAFAKGGALETVKDGVTGRYFHQQTAEAVIEAVNLFEKDMDSYDSEIIRKQALGFRKEIFLEKMRKYINQIVEETM